MDELSYAKRTIRIYRHAIAEILDVVVDAESRSTVARDVMAPIRRAQWRLDKLKASVPASLDPTSARTRRQIAALEEFP